MWWWTLLYVFLALLAAHVLRLVLFASSGNNNYSGKGLYTLYIWRYFWRFCEVCVEQFITPRRMNNFDRSGTSFYTCGAQATPSEQDLEMPKPLLTDRHEDSVQLFGMDKEGRAIVAVVVRLTQRRACVILTVVDAKGQLYTLPGQPDTNYLNITDSGWKAGGLMLQCVEPMQCWRLKFNGLLRRGTRDEYITEDDDDCDEDDIIHARLDFLWHAMREPVDIWKESSPRLLARALARHPRNSRHLFSLVDSMSLERDEYEQWGTLHGEVRLGGEPTEAPQVWYLRGSRRHRWGLSKAIANFHRSVEIFTYFTNGDLCSLQACSYGTKMSQYVLGYVLKACGDYHPVTSTNLSLSSFDEGGDLPHDLLVKFTAGKKDYDLWHKLGQGVTLNTGDPWTLTQKINFNHAAATHSHGWGLTVFSNRFTDLCPVPEHECLPPLVEPSIEIDDGCPLVVGISSYQCRATNLTGGKGASLGQLMLLKDVSYYPFEVPNGVVVTVSGFRRQLRVCSDLQHAIKAIEQAAGSSYQQQLKDYCDRAVEVFKNAKICPEVEEALRNIIEEEFEDEFEGRRYAVRSSGCSEDGEESSAAGQNETLLGVEGFDNILKAIAACWASQFTFQSVEYRRQRGQVVNGGMAVVVQEMVKAEVAGVLFTQDPVTGNPANITITANYGLGESVVSASAEPDTVVVRRTWRDKLSVATMTNGAKKTKFIVNESGGTSEVDVDDDDRGKICLSKDVALRLAHVAIYLQNAYGTPRDIEFAVLKDTLYLLQARPVTGLDSWTDFEITHELDSAILTDRELYTKSNVGEVFPGALSPLTISTITSFLEVAFQLGEKCTMTFNPHYQRLSGTAFMQIFLNVLQLQYRLNSDQMTLALEASDLSIHGHKVAKKEYWQLGVKRFGVMTKYAVVQSLVSLVYSKVTASRRIEKDRERFGKFDLGEDRATSADILYAEITRRLPELIQITGNHVTTSKVSSSTQIITFMVLAEGKDEFSKDNRADMAALLSSCTGVESADVPSAIKKVAQVIAENEEVNDFLSMTYEEAKVWLESHPGLVGTAYRGFLAKHGHRCVKELDLNSLSWNLDPRPLVESLQALVRFADRQTTTRDEISIEEAINNLQTKVKEGTKKTLRFLSPICRDAIVQREATKSLITKVIDGFRKAYLKLGQLMVSELMLPESRLIFFLKHQEIGELIRNRSPILVFKAIRRRRLHKKLETFAFPEISVGQPVPIIVPDSAEQRPIDGGDLTLKGTTVCQGVVTATARVITRLPDAVTIQNGDILVTKSTDVGWTPYFPLLSGVVTEIGGLISHGAVVAREYGLPCLVGVASATSLLSSGDTIVLNAIQGTITRIAEKSEATEASS